MVAISFDLGHLNRDDVVDEVVELGATIGRRPEERRRASTPAEDGEYRRRGDNKEIGAGGSVVNWANFDVARRTDVEPSPRQHHESIGMGEGVAHGRNGEVGPDEAHLPDRPQWELRECHVTNRKQRRCRREDVDMNPA
ncbi:MAG: hypothetical protein M3501_02230 [Actinomycetota bacterium]|nr:hypothetical protein [Actinomycetota bacterium]MDQ3350767.1 hypothetical protein [Actinomycetota bacterium]